MNNNDNLPDIPVNKKSSIEKVQMIYFYISMSVLLFSIIILGLGIANLYILSVFPDEVFEFLRIFIYYHIFNFFAGIVILIFLSRHNSIQTIKVRILNTVLGIISSPISIVITFVGFLLLGFSSCAANT